MDKMEYIKIPLCGKRGKGKYTLVDGDYDGEYFSQYRWYLSPVGYVVRDGRYETGKGGSYIYLHKEVLRPKPGLVADHINRDKLDNRSCNLRNVTHQENALNRPQSVVKSSKSGFRGVVRDTRVASRWSVVIKGKHSGYFSDVELAAKAYDKLAKFHFGKDAILNFP